MKRGFAIESADVQVVSSVREYQDRVGTADDADRGITRRPPVLKSTRDAVAGAPATKTVSDVVAKK